MKCVLTVVIIIILIVFISCVCLSADWMRHSAGTAGTNTHTEAFASDGKGPHFCVSAANRETRGEPLSSTNRLVAGKRSVALETAKQLCADGRHCSFFTCAPDSEPGQCKAPVFYHRTEGAAAAAARDPALALASVPQRVFTKSATPCNNYCFSYTNTDTKGKAVSNVHQERSAAEAADGALPFHKAVAACELHPECNFFTCSGATTGNGGACKDMQMYNSTDPNGQSNVAGNQEMYTKTKQACTTSIDATPLRRRDTINAYTLPYAQTTYGHRSMYSNIAGKMAGSPTRVVSRECSTNASGTTSDSNCFLDKKEGELAMLYNKHKNQHSHTHASDAHNYYKDGNHNIYLRQTDMCRVPDAETARKVASRVPGFQEVNLPAEHPCSSTSAAFAFSEKCRGLCKNPSTVYRSDLRACVPYYKKCDFKNSMVCDRNSSKRANFEAHCPNARCPEVAPGEKPGSGNRNSSPCSSYGQPYYTYVGSANEVINIVNEMTQLSKDMAGLNRSTSRIVLIDPMTDRPRYMLTSVKPNTETSERPVVTVTDIESSETGIECYVVSLSYGLQFIELYPTNQPATNTKYYVIERHVDITNLSRKLKDVATKKGKLVMFTDSDPTELVITKADQPKDPLSSGLPTVTAKAPSTAALKTFVVRSLSADVTSIEVQPADQSLHSVKYTIQTKTPSHLNADEELAMVNIRCHQRNPGYRSVTAVKTPCTAGACDKALAGSGYLDMCDAGNPQYTCCAKR